MIECLIIKPFFLILKYIIVVHGFGFSIPFYFYLRYVFCNICRLKKRVNNRKNRGNM